MTVLNEADKLYLGTQQVDVIFAGANKVWPSFSPSNFSGLTVWLDASQLGLVNGANVSPWPDLSGKGNHGVIVGTPSPVVRTNALNGKSVVRFKPNDGRLRGNTGILTSGLTAPAYNYSIIVVERMVGPNIGRCFAGAYPTANFLVGFHTVGQDVVYDGAWINDQGNAYAWGTLPGPWKLYSYSGSHNGIVYNVQFVKGGVVLFDGSAGSGQGLHGRFMLSGYDETGVAETCDCEVAELLIYDHRLLDAERIQVEEYLKAKWGL